MEKLDVARRPGAGWRGGGGGIRPEKALAHHLQGLAGEVEASGRTGNGASSHLPSHRAREVADAAHMGGAMLQEMERTLGLLTPQG